MTTSTTPATPGAGVAHFQAAFLKLVPVLAATARRHFRGVRCPDRRRDSVCEVIGLGWSWYCRLRTRGRDPAEFPATFARLAARAVNCGRRLCGSERARDVLSPVAQRRREFTVSPIPAGSAMFGNVFDDALKHNTQSPVPDQVAFKIDTFKWLRRLPPSKRKIARRLAEGHSTQDVARMFNVSPGRISQLRRELMQSYLSFTGDAIGV